MRNRHGVPLLAGLALVLIGWKLAPAEERAAGAVPAGRCDSPYPDAQGNMTMVCHGLTDDQLRLLPHVSSLANRILQSGVEEERLDSKAGDILKILQTSSEPKAAVPAPSAPPSRPPPEKDVMTYDYRGFKTSSLRGPLFADDQASLAYQDLLALQKKDEWKKLLKEAERQAKKTPEWLTPHAFKAVALHHLSRDPEAITALEYVVERSTGNPEYDQVRNLLKQLKSARPVSSP